MGVDESADVTPHDELSPWDLADLRARAVTRLWIESALGLTLGLAVLAALNR